MITGAIMMVVGVVVSAFLGSVFGTKLPAWGDVRPMDARPYPVYGIISPLYAEIAFIMIAVLGLGLLVWAVTGTGWAKP